MQTRGSPSAEPSAPQGKSYPWEGGSYVSGPIGEVRTGRGWGGSAFPHEAFWRFPRNDAVAPFNRARDMFLHVRNRAKDPVPRYRVGPVAAAPLRACVRISRAFFDRITFTTARYAAVTIAIQCDDMSGLPSSGYPYYTSRADGSHSWFGRQTAGKSAITRRRERQDEPPKRLRSICNPEAQHDGGPFPIATKSQATSVRSTGTHECFLENGCSHGKARLYEVTR